MSRADNGVEDVDDEFTQQAKDAANAAAAREDAADETATEDSGEVDAEATSTTKKAADKPAKSKAGTDTAKGSKDKASQDKAPKDKHAAADGDADKSTKRSRREPKPAKIASGLNPSWWVPTMLGLMVLGLIWLVVFYLSGSKYPVPGIGTWNLAIGFVLLMAGFAMTTRWK